MSRVFFDTMLFVYLLEDHPQYAQRVEEILEKLSDRNDELYTSALALGEILAGAQFAQGRPGADEIEIALEDIQVRVLPFTKKEAPLFAQIRKKKGATPADAVHLACAAAEGMDVFVTNDRKLIGQTIPGIQFIVGLDTNLY
jgi:uncharacterized protein